ncbi:MAG TPA: hypothetical protein VJP05_03380 [Acidimicrobiia bacterium]|nr:hypothetical protein [Acidimicrobiia bacterium]
MPRPTSSSATTVPPSSMTGLKVIVVFHASILRETKAAPRVPAG